VNSKNVVKVELTREENYNHYGVTESTILHIDIEEYLKGVVPAEVGNAHIEAAKAQAVAARSYALYYAKKGLQIDDTTKYQAYRAIRANEKDYPNAIRAVNETAGEIIVYKGALIDKAFYSDSNGGKTQSISGHGWSGGDKPYFIVRDDPWTKASGKPRNGHGIGLSQQGSSYAAKNGIGYAAILAFYYVGTQIAGEYGAKMPEEEPVEKTIYRAEVVTRNPFSLNIWTDTKKSRSLTKVRRGAIVEVLGEVSGRWAKVRYGVNVGFCDTKYLKRVKEPITYKVVDGNIVISIDNEFEQQDIEKYLNDYIK
jgi:hypothetical protein